MADSKSRQESTRRQGLLPRDFLSFELAPFAGAHGRSGSRMVWIRIRADKSGESFTAQAVAICSRSFNAWDGRPPVAGRSSCTSVHRVCRSQGTGNSSAPRITFFTLRDGSPGPARSGHNEAATVVAGGVTADVVEVVRAGFTQFAFDRHSWSRASRSCAFGPPCHPVYRGCC